MALAGAASPAASAEREVEAGREIFEANCAMCHGADAEGMMGMHPSLRGAVDRLSREGVEVTIRNGRDTTPPMPAFGGRLTEAQIDNVIAYVDSLPEGPRNFGPGDGMIDRQGTRNGDGMMGDGMMDGMMGGLMLLWVLLLLALIALAMAGVVWLVRTMRRSNGGSSGATQQSAARAELDRRYASGELPREDYLQRRSDLEG